MQLRDTRGKSTAALLFYFLFLAPAAVSAHGFLQTITTPEQLYPCWSPHTDSYQKPEPKRYTRRYPNNGPIPDFTSDDIACNVGGNAPISEYISVKAGDKITFQWDTWPESHQGPIMTYLLPCLDTPCSKLTLPTASSWYKIHQSGYDPRTNAWATDRLLSRNLTSTIVLPSTLPRGEYLLRHEILALHQGGQEKGAQFYPSCAQIKVESDAGDAEKVWGRLKGVQFPGAYEVDGEGVLYNIYGGDPKKKGYTPPGGEVVKIPGDESVQDETPLEGKPVVSDEAVGGSANGGNNGGGSTDNGNSNGGSSGDASGGNTNGSSDDEKRKVLEQFANKVDENARKVLGDPNGAGVLEVTAFLKQTYGIIMLAALCLF